MGLLNTIIRTAVVSVLGAKLAKGRSPIVAALMMLLVSKALAKRSGDATDSKETGPSQAAGNEGGLRDLIEKFQKGGLEDVIKSWIGIGANKPIAPDQL